MISPAAAVGVVTTNATEVDVTGKTAEELKDSDFAALLNSNRSESAMAAAMEEINAARAEAPVEMGQILLPDLCGTGVPLVATGEVKKGTNRDK